MKAKTSLTIIGFVAVLVLISLSSYYIGWSTGYYSVGCQSVSDIYCGR